MSDNPIPPNFFLAEVQAACNALGCAEEDGYHKEPDCLETVKDLIRFLKRENEYCDVRRFLGECQIVQTDLIPIIKYNKGDKELLETTIRLLVNLTQPAVSCFDNEVPTHKTVLKYYIEVQSHLNRYKESFCDEAVMAILSETLQDIISLDWESQRENDRLLLERILLLLRNVLHIVIDHKTDIRTDDDANIHDQLLWVMHKSGMEDLLLYLASANEESFCMHVLEIVSLMFREQNAKELATVGGDKSKIHKRKEEEELARLRITEEAKRKEMLAKLGSRHSRFAGTVIIKNFKSISDKDMILHKNIKHTKDINFDAHKTARRAPKNRAPIKDREVSRRSTLSIRLFLKDFCSQFLENAYNTLMRNANHALMRSKAQENDDTYFLWAMRFFMEFSRCANMKLDFVSETMNMSTFHYVETHLINYHETITIDKKNAILWSRRLHLALKAYQELLRTLHWMSSSSDLVVKRSAKVIKSNILYVPEFRDVFVMLLRTFDEARQSRSFLRDLIESSHIFLKILESHCKGSNTIMVERKRKKKNKKKKIAKKPGKKTEDDLFRIWESISTDVDDYLALKIPLPEEEVRVFDPASSIEPSEQKKEAMLRIKNALMEKETGTAILLWNTVKEFWPEEFEGEENENEVLRQILMAEIEESENRVENDEEEDNEEDVEDVIVRDEINFDFKEFISKFANSKVVRAYSILLGEWRDNSAAINHAILKMLHRIAFQCNLPGLLFHARIFRTFNEFYINDLSKKREFDELKNFGVHIIRKFVDAVQRNPSILVNFFFWNSTNDALDMIDGFTPRDSKRNKKVAWTEEEEEQLKNMFENLKEEEEEENGEGGAAGDDIVDKLVRLLPGRPRTRRQIIRQLVHLGLLQSARDLKKKKKGGNELRRTWNEDEEEELRMAFNEFKETDDIVGCILDSLKVKRSKAAVINKLLSLGLISDRKEVRRKKKKNNFVLEKEQDNEEDELDVDTLDDIITSYQRKSLNPDIGLDWVISLLTRAIDDRGDGEDQEATAIIPLKDEDEECLDDPHFTRILKKIGFRKPDMVQERYWRIPADLSCEYLEECCDTVKVKKDDCPEDINVADILKGRQFLDDSFSDTEPSTLGRGLFIGASDDEGDEEEEERLRIREEIDSLLLNKTRPASETLEDVIKVYKSRTNDYYPGLDWVSTFLRKAIDSRKDCLNPESMAVVPIREEEEEYLEDENFSKILKKIGLKQPDLIQERYWRIPAELSLEYLEEISDTLQAEKSADEENEDMDFSEMIRKRRIGEDSDSDVETFSVKRKKLILDDDDDDD
ncbi:DgyrCDS5281 [Dimorphilus gyrociliatus]|uniref:DgyrCDS5281 n=1 Tax=Dimorphilus gyrociliatus TaxID=2664684 RepID=A0A7I8VJD2_9ANNE|nr:DgyrCDS5281 [Dimorphilus gyrociliatus]